MRAKGERVGAIQKADEHEVFFYGYGTYQGEEIPPTGFLNEIGAKNPKILLDNGDVVWGYECWWASEAKVKSMIGNRKIVMVKTDA